jgi:hypothetical protein
MKFYKIFFICLAFLAGAATTQADLIIYQPPGTGPFDSSLGVVAYGTQTSQAEINTVIASVLGSAVELYKSNVDSGEEKPFAPYYNTTFSNSPTDPMDALIDYTGGINDPYIGPIAYLLVKDGNQNPAWYLFNLTFLGWDVDGRETIFVEDFWPRNGAISHVSLYGTPVPEPATMLLLGAGLIGLASYGRKKLI